jgi:DNA-binding CsgD family transcriptional regulator
MSTFRRIEERARLDDLVMAAAAGHGGALRVAGERGMGKSAALDYAVEQAAGFRVLRIRAVAAERDLPYAGLHLLWDGPVPASLTAVFGLSGTSRPGVDVVGPATLDLLTGLARTRPVCVVVDDAHWLDDATAQVLTYVAEHAAGHALLVLLGEDPAGTGPDGPIPAMYLGPLCEEEVSGLFAGALAGPIDGLVAERVLEESHGNPRALGEALAGLAALAGGFGIPGPRRDLACELGHDCVERAADLTPVERRLLLGVAAEPTGDVALFRKLAADLGADPAELVTRRLLVVGDRVTFTCSRLRCVTYHAAAPDERRLIHRRLADHTGDDRPRRAWHLGLAATGPDDALAAELEGNAERAQARGGAAARAAFLAMAALLTSDPARRADRALAAAGAKYDSGDLAAAQRMLARVDAEPDDVARCARRSWYRARIETAVRPGPGSARHLLDAARRLRTHDPVSAREAYLEVLLSAIPVESGPTLAEAAREALAEAAGHREHPADLLLHGLSVRILDGYAASVRPLRSAITAFHQGEADSRAARWLGPAALIAADLWEEQAWRDLTRRSDGAYRMPGPGAHSAAAVAALHNATGRYEEAIYTVRDSLRRGHPGFVGRSLAELVEAAVRAGDPDLAAQAQARLDERTEPAGTDWAAGVRAATAALLAGGADAEASYREAIDRLGRTGQCWQLARAELTYGEWLRRRNRRIDARVQLRSAGEHFAALGASAFAERAGRELLATGEAARKRTVESMRQLTPQEVRVASLARDGLSNAEIAERLFVSPRTVEYHLHKAFAKLGVKSRAKLHSVRGLD